MRAKIVLTLLPAAVIAPTHTSAMSATSNAYSSRSCPSSRTHRVRILAIKPLIMSSVSACRPSLPMCAAGRLRQRRRDASEDRVDVAAGRGDRADAHQRDERHEQRVFEEVLPLFVTNEREHAIHEFH